MKVSVVIPVYNDELYIEECLSSVLAQTYRNLEVICVDDGSTDGSAALLRKAAESDSRIQIIRQENQGLSAARNRGLLSSSGTYLLFVDSDDALVPDAIERLVAIAEQSQLDQITFGAHVYCDVNSHAITDKLLKREEDYFTVKDRTLFHSFFSGEDLFERLIACDSFYVSVCVRFYRRDLLERENIRFFNGIIHEDNLFMPLAMFAAKRTVVIPDKLYLRRMRDGSIMTSAEHVMKHVVGYLVTALKLQAIVLPNPSCRVALEKYLTYLFRKAHTFLPRSCTADDVLACCSDLLTEQEREIIRNTVFPLLLVVNEFSSRAQKYRDKRLSSRIKRLFKKKGHANDK